MLRKLCVACEAPLAEENGLCRMCFTQSSLQNYRLSCDFMTQLQFLITDAPPADLKQAIAGQPDKTTKAFVKLAQQAKVLVLLKYNSRYVGGLLGSRREGEAGLYLDYWGMPGLPSQLTMFLGALMIAAALKGEQEELIMPPQLAKYMLDYWNTHLPLLEVPEFLDAGKSKKLLLRTLDYKFVQDSMEAIQKEFNEFINDPQFSQRMKQLSGAESPK